MKLNIPARNIKPQVKEVFADLVLDLENGQYTIYDLRTAMTKLDQLTNFGFIVPRRILSSITVPYLLEELPYESMSIEEPSTQAYKRWDGVMIKAN